MSTLQAEITVSVVLYNSLQLLKERQDFFAGLPHLCLVDNASSDGSADWIAVHLPQAKLFRCTENLGFGRGHNLALAACDTPFALLLNPDCEIDAPAMGCLVQCLMHYPDALLAVPRLTYPDGREQENHRGFMHSGGRPQAEHSAPEGALCCEFVSGAALMVRVQWFQEVGGFDPWFFLYWEDEDLCLRARANRRAVILEPAALACHALKRSSTPTAKTLFTRHYSYITSKLYLRRKMGEPLALTVLRAAALLLSNTLSMLLSLLLLDRGKVIRRAARIVAVLTAPLQLARAQAVSSPLKLFGLK